MIDALLTSEILHLYNEWTEASRQVEAAAEFLRNSLPISSLLQKTNSILMPSSPRLATQIVSSYGRSGLIVQSGFHLRQIMC